MFIVRVTVMVTVMVTCPDDDEIVAGDIVTPKSCRCCCSSCCIVVVIPHAVHMFKTIDICFTMASSSQAARIFLLLHDGMV